ncbi:MAG: Os1348 family NHLP clan protein [Syntrophobacteraceae bacterium]
MPTTPLSDQANQIIARALIDPQFRKALAANPDSTLKSAAPGLTAADIASIKALKPSEWGALTMSDLDARLGKYCSWKISSIER